MCSTKKNWREISTKESRKINSLPKVFWKEISTQKKLRWKQYYLYQGLFSKTSTQKKLWRKICQTISENEYLANKNQKTPPPISFPTKKSSKIFPTRNVYQKIHGQYLPKKFLRIHLYQGILDDMFFTKKYLKRNLHQRTISKETSAKEILFDRDFSFGILW